MGRDGAGGGSLEEVKCLRGGGVLLPWRPEVMLHLPAALLQTGGAAGLGHPATRSSASGLLGGHVHPSCTSAQYELLLGTEYKIDFL